MKILDDVFKQEWKKPFPRAIQIETYSVCNSHCSYCPYENNHSEPVKYPDYLFNEFIDEITYWKPQLIVPYMNNEPLADKTFFKKLSRIRFKLPETFIDFSTNATLLDRESSEKLIENEVDEIKINFPSIIKEEYEKLTGMNYENTLNNVVDFVNLAKNIHFKGRYRVVMVGAEDNAKEFWDKIGIESKIYNKVSRGGIISTPFSIRENVNGCKFNRQNEWLHILSDANVVLCCMDWKKEYVLGNLEHNNIYQIWNSDKYKEIRSRISNSSDKSFICNKCEWAV